MGVDARTNQYCNQPALFYVYTREQYKPNTMENAESRIIKWRQNLNTCAMKTLNELYLRNDVLLLFLWKQNGEVFQHCVWQPKDAASLLTTKSEDELKILIESANLLPEFFCPSAMESLRVYRVGSVQELFPNVEFIPR